jgi:hypothetical protein
MQILITHLIYCTWYYKVGACIVSPMKKIVAIGHHRKLSKAADKIVSASGPGSTDQNDLEHGMKDEDALDFGKYL